MSLTVSNNYYTYREHLPFEGFCMKRTDLNASLTWYIENSNFSIPS
jgi:hypothetical protein